MLTSTLSHDIHPLVYGSRTAKIYYRWWVGHLWTHFDGCFR